MLKHIPIHEYDDETTYRICVECCIHDYQKIYNGPLNKSTADGTHRHTPDICVRNWINYDSINDFDECGMERLVMLIAGMLFCMDNGGISDDDPADLAYNTWLAIQDFSTGEFDDLFRPDDLADLKADIRRINEYFDQHPKLKG